MSYATEPLSSCTIVGFLTIKSPGLITLLGLYANTAPTHDDLIGMKPTSSKNIHVNAAEDAMSQ